MPNKFEKLTEEAGDLTDEQFRVRFSSLTKLTDDDVLKILRDTGISKEDLANVLLEIKKAGEINNKTLEALSNIRGGLQTLVTIAKRLLL